jgi:hypothetical protein
MMHYSIKQINTFEELKEIFGDDAKADDLNFCLFSTSGIHGTYLTIEDIEQSFLLGEDNDAYCGTELTVLVIHPRTVTLKYGNIEVTKENIDWLKTLRQSSKEAVAKIGA